MNWHSEQRGEAKRDEWMPVSGKVEVIAPGTMSICILIRLKATSEQRADTQT